MYLHRTLLRPQRVRLPVRWRQHYVPLAGHRAGSTAPPRIGHTIQRLAVCAILNVERRERLRASNQQGYATRSVHDNNTTRTTTSAAFVRPFAVDISVDIVCVSCAQRNGHPRAFFFVPTLYTSYSQGTHSAKRYHVAVLRHFATQCTSYPHH